MKRVFTRLFLLIIPGVFLLSSCSSVFYYPNKGRLYYDPKAAGYAPEDIYFTDAAQRKLHGWWFSAKESPAKGTIIFFHGNAENLTQ